MKMIVGLGNPGKNFEKTRHNIGFEIIRNFVKKFNLNICENEKKELVFIGKYLERDIVLIEPKKFMNNSGESVSYFSKYFKISPEKIIVIHDDINLPLGKIRFKNKGSSGGHNGIKSVISHLNSEDFKRLKIGIGYNKKFRLEDWVIGKFSQEELSILNKINENILEILVNWILEK